MKTYLLALLFLTACGSNSSTSAPDDDFEKVLSTHSCGKDSVGSVDYAWCFDRPAQNVDDSNIVVYLHGIYGSEQTWSETPEFGRALAQARPQKTPTVVSVSLGPIWLLSTLEEDGRKSVYKLFLNNILPAVEARLQKRVKVKVLFGESMGGFNATQIVARQNSTQQTGFERVVLLCPALSDVDPFASPAVVTAYLQAHPEVDPNSFGLAAKVAQATFGGEAGYAPHDPKNLVTTLSVKTSKFFISAGTRDEYGFYAESAAFASAAKTRGANVTWFSITDGKHCEQTPTSLAALTAFLR